ncbi:hypothetical protein DERP_015331, partial [Dermatophagoides pteronyssinus]
MKIDKILSTSTTSDQILRNIAKESTFGQFRNSLKDVGNHIKLNSLDAVKNLNLERSKSLANELKQNFSLTSNEIVMLMNEMPNDLSFIELMFPGKFNKEQTFLLFNLIDQYHCGLHNVYSVSVDGCDDQRSTNDECVILNKNSLSYSITFSATISARMLYNNETFQQSKQTDIINNIGDLCKNPSKYQLDSCPIEANHILRIQKTITYMNRFSINYPLILEDKYYSSNDPNRLMACSRIRLQYYDSRYTTTTTYRPTTDRHHDDDDDKYREWLEILTRVLRQSEELANKTETKLRQHYPNHQNLTNDNPIIQTLETQLIQLRIDITGIWLEIRNRILRADENMREFRLFVERSSQTLWKYGEQLRLTVDILDEFGWNYHNDTNKWITKQISPLLEQLLQRLRSMYGYLEQHHSQGDEQTRIEEFIEIINKYSDYINGTTNIFSEHRSERFDQKLFRSYLRPGIITFD